MLNGVWAREGPGMARQFTWSLLLLLVLPAEGNAAGFAMSDNFTVFTPAYPNPADTEAFAREVLQSAEGMAARDRATVVGGGIAAQRRADDRECRVQRQPGRGRHVGQR